MLGSEAMTAAHATFHSRLGNPDRAITCEKGPGGGRREHDSRCCEIELWRDEVEVYAKQADRNRKGGGPETGGVVSWLVDDEDVAGGNLTAKQNRIRNKTLSLPDRTLQPGVGAEVEMDRGVL